MEQEKKIIGAYYGIFQNTRTKRATNGLINIKTIIPTVYEITRTFSIFFISFSTYARSRATPKDNRRSYTVRTIN